MGWLGPGHDPAVVELAYTAAEAYIGKRVRWTIPANPDLPAPDDLVQAVRFQTARYLSRRNSPDGMVGLGSELGIARIPITDQDVQTLINPYRPVVT